MMKKFAAVIIPVIIIAAGICVSDAHAYLDPGTGSYVFQVIIAAVLGIIVTIKIYWNKIKFLVSQMFRRKSK